MISLGLVVGLVGAAPAYAGKKPPGDPPGNNGTIKIVASDPSDPDPGNEPQLDTCMLWLEFYGFDLNQTADVVFTAQPPTGDKELLRWTGTISDDAAGGGQDDDEVIGFNLSAALQGLEAHPQQGYHVKVTSDSKEAPGGAKQKVFWLKCATEAPGSLVLTKATEGAAGPGPFVFDLSCNHKPLDRMISLKAGESATVDSVPAGTLCVATETDKGGAASNRFTEAPADELADGKVTVKGGQATKLDVVNVFPAAANAAGAAGGTGTQVAGASLTQEGTGTSAAALNIDNLPRTGGEPWRPVAVALLCLVAGAVALAFGRRPARQAA